MAAGAHLQPAGAPVMEATTRQPAGQGRPEKLLHFSSGRQLPMILQTEAAECGLVCLAMIAGFHGYDTDLAGLRRRFHISSHGTNLKALMDMAGRLHLAGRALRLEMEHLEELQHPCVLHWDMSHFVVLKSVQRNKIIIMESVRAIQTVKLFQRENDPPGPVAQPPRRCYQQDIRIARWNIGYNTINRLLFGLENLLVIYFAATAVMGNILTVGMLYAFMSYKTRFVASMDALIAKWIELKMLGLHLDRLSDIVFTQVEDIDRPDSWPMSVDQAHALQGKIEVRKLGFQFGEAEAPAFQDVNFTIEAGETVAIVGPSGCGKTTLLKCLMGLLEPTEGEILIDGQPLKKLPNYRSQIAGVMQDDQLLAGTVGDNIACFEPQVDLQRIVHCANMACIHEDIMHMPMQYNTLVGDMGTSLSGGQKQRIVMARALYRAPRILFMDEATSHLDIANESLVNQHIQQLAITRILVAHRPETVASAGRRIQLTAGETANHN